jgi:CheY-like chemotaxis protein/anti-sigma regulatory factor (Ser/Thr protein kinase)
MRTLIIDDDQDQREVVRTVLERGGLGPVTEAVDGASGLAAAATDAPELIVLDIAMPGPSGLDILPELVQLAPRARVVVLSSHPRSLHGDEARRRGATGYVEKRVPVRHLLAQILVAAAITETALEVVSAELPADPASVRSARALVLDALGDDGEDLLFSLELLISEVVSNAVVHASSAPRIEAQLGPDTVRVAVYDDDPTLPTRRHPDADRPGGRGLHLLDRLASRWGAEAIGGDGKVVWFELDRAMP